MFIFLSKQIKIQDFELTVLDDSPLFIYKVSIIKSIVTQQSESFYFTLQPNIYL